MPRHNHRDPESDPKVFLGDELARARVAAGYASQEALAAKLGFERSVIGKVESGDRVPSPEVLAAWCEASGLDYDHYGRLAKLARASDGPVQSWFVPWLEVEPKAQVIRAWSPVLLPGLLQTGGYARPLFIAAGATEEYADELVTVRVERQAILDRPHPPRIVTVFDESVLHRLIGSPQVMHDALTHVADLSQRPNIVVQVVPSAKGANAGLSGAFYLANGPDATDTLSMIGIEDQTTDNRALVSKANAIFDLVRADAMTRDDSRAAILESVDQWKAR
jgi:transcriptional regulator with XRE-family HTH domain